MRPRYQSLIGLVLMCLCSRTQAAEMTYQINKSYSEVVRAVERVVNEPLTTPFKVPNLPAVVEPLDIVNITSSINPKSREYHATLKVKKGALSLVHTLNLDRWSGEYRIEATIDIQWCGRSRIANAIARRIIPRAECKFLELERCKIMKLAADMDTPEVELMEDSWLKVMVAAYKVMKRAMELK